MSESSRKQSTSKLVQSDAQLEATRREFIAWVDHILERKKMTPTDLALASGLAPSTLLRILNSKTHPFNISFMTMRKVSDGSGYPIPRSLLEAHDITNIEQGPEAAPKLRPQAAKNEKARQSLGKDQETQMPQRTIPLRYVSSLPASLVQQVRDDVSIACPADMLNDDTAFAFRMPDEALAPIVRGGMTLFATKRRDPTVGDILLVTDQSGRSRVRVIEAIDETGFKLQRTGPTDAQSETIGFDDIKEFGVVEGIWRR